MLDREKLLTAIDRACSWITDIAQIKEEGEEAECQKSFEMPLKSWKGAVRGEYTVSNKLWGMFCPVWHTGQAAKALCMAYELTGNQKWLDKAIFCGDFILNNQITDENSEEYGLIYAIEDGDNCANTSAIMECLESMRWLYRVTKDEKYKKAYVNAADWIVRTVYEGDGHFTNLYNVVEHEVVSEIDRRFVPPIGYFSRSERPLADDSVMLHAYEFSGDEKYRKVFYETVDYLKANEVPSGTWNNYSPSKGMKGISHPRQSFWWGHPMYYAYKDTHDIAYFDSLFRCGEWYLKAMRTDGGFFRTTNTLFKTPGFELCTSGSACAAIVWMKLYELDHSPRWMEAVEKALQFNMKVQFYNTVDPNLEGAILERTVPIANGSDASPYQLRDLASIFFVQAACDYLGVKG